MAELDEIDRKILTELQDNARLTNNELASRVGLSPSPCWRRVKRLEEDGIIRQYVTLINRDKAGYHVMAFTSVSLENHHAETVQAFDEAIQSLPEVLECVLTSGANDFLLRIVAPDIVAYEKFLTEKLMQIPYVRSVSTSFVLRRSKFTTALPLSMKSL